MNRTQWTSLALTAVLTLTVSLASLAQKPAVAPVKPEPAESKLTIEQKLTERKIKVNFKDLLLEDVIEYFRGISKANIVVMWPALETQGVDRATPCTLNLDDVTVMDAIKLTLEKAGLTFTGAAIVPEIRGNVLVITPVRKDEVRRAEQAADQRTMAKVQVLSSLQETYDQPLQAVLMAIAGLRDVHGDDLGAYAGRLETLLAVAKSVSARNALRLTLKDVYLEMGRPKEAASLLEDVITTNDAVLAREEQPVKKAPAQPAGR